MPTPQSSDAFLQVMLNLGDRVRELRRSESLSRRELAQRAQVSQRHLAQLETGQGNVSLKLLMRIATALRTDLSQLLRSIPVEDRWGSVNRRAIALIGLRGAGKTTLGQGLSTHFGLPFIRLVEEIESLAGMAVSEIFSLSGEEGYRRYEAQALETCLESGAPTIIEAGGSIVADAGVYQVLLDRCLVIWLKARPEEHMQRVIDQGDSRPMEGFDDAMHDLRRILSEREPSYARAHLTLNTANRDPASSLGMLISLVRDGHPAAAVPTIQNTELLHSDVE